MAFGLNTLTDDNTSQLEDKFPRLRVLITGTVRPKWYADSGNDSNDGSSAGQVSFPSGYSKHNTLLLVKPFNPEAQPEVSTYEMRVIYSQFSFVIMAPYNQTSFKSAGATKVSYALLAVDETSATTQGYGAELQTEDGDIAFSTADQSFRPEVSGRYTASQNFGMFNTLSTSPTVFQDNRFHGLQQLGNRNHKAQKDYYGILDGTAQDCGFWQPTQTDAVNQANNTYYGTGHYRLSPFMAWIYRTNQAAKSTAIGLVVNIYNYSSSTISGAPQTQPFGSDDRGTSIGVIK